MLETEVVNRNLSIPNLQNVRDLGGLPTRDGQTTRWRSLLRADNLQNLTPAGLQALHDYGVSLVIDLRWPAELEHYPTAYPANDAERRYFPLSLLGESVEAWVERSNNVAWEDWQRAVLDLMHAEMAAVLRAIAASSGTVLFHCAAGKDRTGVIAALLLALADVEPEAIGADYAASSENLRAAWLAGQPEEKWPEIIESLSCPPERIQVMLAHLDQRYGGPAGYMAAIGLSEAEVRQVRARLRVEADAP
jgi:protein-tyrosine phosphatase